jgi:hypothetical protein
MIRAKPPAGASPDLVAVALWDLWSEVSLTYENGYTIIKGTDHGNGISYMPREGIVKIDQPSAVMLDTTTIPGLYLIRPYSPSVTTHLQYGRRQ